MGRQQYYVTQKGPSMSEAYTEACRDAEEEHGHEQGYSGEINMSQGIRDLTRTFKNSGKKLDAFVDDVMEGDDYVLDEEALAICIKEPKLNANKIKTQVEHHVVKGARKWVLYYTVYETGWEPKYLGKKKLKDQAVVLGRDHTARSGNSTIVKMERLLEGSEPTVSTIRYKPSSNERDGTYYFFGNARS